MKKSIILLGCAALVMAACNKVETVVVPVEEPAAQEPAKHLNVNFTVNYGEGTRAVKTEWKAGDKIYVVFDVTFLENDGYYMTLTFNGSSWISEFSDPALETKLIEKETGTLAAAYLAADEDPVFEYDNTTEAYVRRLIMTNQDQLKGFFLATPSGEDVRYEVSDGTLTAELNMTLRAKNTLHFYLPSISSENAGNYTLCCSKLQSTHFDRFTYLYIEYGGDNPIIGGPWMDYTEGGYGKPIPGSYYDYGLEFVALLESTAVGKEMEYVFYVVDNKGTVNDTSDDTIYSLTKTVTFEGKEAIRLPWLNESGWTILSPSDISPTFNGFYDEVYW